MAPTRFVLLTLALLAFVSLASAYPKSGPPSCSESGNKTCAQTCCQTNVGYYQSLIAKASGDSGLISDIIKALDDLLDDLLDLTNGDLGGIDLSDLIKLINIVLEALGDIINCLLDLLAGKLTEEQCKIKCQAIVVNCVAECRLIPGSGGVIDDIITFLTNLLDSIFGSGGDPPGPGCGTTSDSGLLTEVFDGVGGLLSGSLGTL